MAAIAAPYGFVPNRHPSGDMRALPYTIDPANTTAIYKNQPVTLATTGFISASVVNTDIIGVFAGVEYVDGNGKPCVSNNWPAGGVAGATNVVAMVYDDPAIEFLVQASGPVASTAVGDQADLSNGTANGFGMSRATLNATLSGAAAQGQFRIVGFRTGPDSVPGDAFTDVLVKIARHQFVTSKVAL